MTRKTTNKTLGDYTALLRRRWRYPVLIIPAALMLATFLAYALTPTYRSTSTIMLEPSSLPASMVQSSLNDKNSSVTLDQQLELTRRRVLDKDTLLKLVQEVDPYPTMKDVPQSVKASFVANDTTFEAVNPVTFEPLANSTAFSIYYDNSNRELATKVNDRLAEMFLTYNRRSRVEAAAQAHEFLQKQSDDLVTSMQGMERQLADFKAKFGDALPDAQGRNLMGLDRTQRDLSDVERDVRDAEGEENLLELQLKDVNPSLTGAVGDWRTELARMRGELAQAEQKYTPEHPDVKRLRRAIADLAAQGGASGATVQATPDNPEYLRIQSQLRAKQRELGALRANAARIRNDLYGYQRNLTTAPNVERDYLQIARQYENSRSRYEDLQTKIKQAAFTENLETEARGERFTLIRPSSTPTKPFSPNRIGFLLIGLILGSGLAVLLAVLRDSSDPTVRSVDDLLDEMDVTPIGAVPVMLNISDIRKRRMTWGTVAAAYAIALVVVSATVILH